MNLFRRLWAKLQGDSVPDMARLRGGRVPAPARNPHWTKRRKMSPAEEAEAEAALRKGLAAATRIDAPWTAHELAVCDRLIEDGVKHGMSPKDLAQQRHLLLADVRAGVYDGFFDDDDAGPIGWVAFPHVIYHNPVDECVQPTAATHPGHLICPFCGERVGQTDFHWHDDRASGAMEPRRIWHCTAGHIWTIVGGIRTEVPVSKEPESFREDWDRPDMAVYDKM